MLAIRPSILTCAPGDRMVRRVLEGLQAADDGLGTRSAFRPRAHAPTTPHGNATWTKISIQSVFFSVVWLCQRYVLTRANENLMTEIQSSEKDTAISYLVRLSSYADENFNLFGFFDFSPCQRPSLAPTTENLDNEI